MIGEGLVSLHVRHPARPPQQRPRAAPISTRHVLARDVGIRFKGAEKTNVEEYCVQRRLDPVAAGNAKDRYGNPLTFNLTGTVEPFFKTRTPG